MKLVLNKCLFGMLSICLFGNVYSQNNTKDQNNNFERFNMLKDKIDDDCLRHNEKIDKIKQEYEERMKMIGELTQKREEELNTKKALQEKYFADRMEVLEKENIGEIASTVGESKELDRERIKQLRKYNKKITHHKKLTKKIQDDAKKRAKKFIDQNEGNDSLNWYVKSLAEEHNLPL